MSDYRTIMKEILDKAETHDKAERNSDKWASIAGRARREQADTETKLKGCRRKVEALEKFVKIYDQWDECVKEFDGDESCCMEYQEAILGAREDLKKAMEGEKAR